METATCSIWLTSVQANGGQSNEDHIGCSGHGPTRPAQVYDDQRHCGYSASMLEVAEQTVLNDGSVSMPVAIILAFAGVLLVTFGHVLARLQRQHADYKATKAAVKPMRQGRWTLFKRTLKRGAVVGIGIILMIAWVARDIRSKDADVSKPIPATVSSSAPHGRR